MNNSFFAVEKVKLTPESLEDRTPLLRTRQEKLVKIIKSIEVLEKSKEWSSLKEEVFDGLVERLSKDLFSEAKKENPDSLKLSRLSGKLEIAEQYDLGKLTERYRMELISIKKQING